MVHERVTAALLRDMKPGKTEVIKTNDPRLIESGKTFTYKMQHQLRCKFKCTTDYANGILKITKEIQSQE